MPNKVLLKKSSVAAKVPLVTDLDYGELAVNYADGKLYYKTATNTISAFTTNVGTVTSVNMTVPTGLTVSGNPITSSGTLAISLTTGYSIPTTASQTNWDTAYSERAQWNGGSTNLVASTGRTSLGATTVGSNLFTLTNPSAITFIRVNADNSISTLDAATFRTAIGAGTSSTNGTVTSVSGTGTVSGLTLSGTVTSSGNLTLGGTLAVTASNFASQTANTFLAAPNGAAGTPTFRTIAAEDVPTLNQNTTGNAATATKLATARTINGVSFDGTANINIATKLVVLNRSAVSVNVSIANALLAVTNRAGSTINVAVS